MQNPESAAMDVGSTSANLQLKKSLHAILSHLQRYKTELQASEKITEGCRTFTRVSEALKVPAVAVSQQRNGSRNDDLFDKLSARFHGLKLYAQELESKTATLFELVGFLSR